MKLYIRFHYRTDFCPNCERIKLTSTHYHACRPNDLCGPATVLAWPKKRTAAKINACSRNQSNRG